LRTVCGRMELRQRPLIALTGLALAKLVVAAIALKSGWQPFVGSNARDHYLPTAERLVTQHRFNGPDSRPDSKVPPLYPAVLAVSALLTGAPIKLILPIQILSDLLTSICLFLMGRDLGRSRSGLAAGIAWQYFPPALAISTWVTAETLFTTAL